VGGFCGGETKSNPLVLLMYDLRFFESYRKLKKRERIMILSFAHPMRKYCGICQKIDLSSSTCVTEESLHGFVKPLIWSI
jgi:hypothetical protein